MALLTARDIVESCTVFLLPAVLRTVAGYTTEATPGYAFIVLSSMVIRIVLELLGNITASVKQLVVVKFAVYKEAGINQVIGLVRFGNANIECCSSFPGCQGPFNLANPDYTDYIPYSRGF
jgi:hypothetical protein